MERVKFGRTDMHVCKIARGWNPYGAEGRAEAARAVHTALDLGVNYRLT